MTLARLLLSEHVPGSRLERMSRNIRLSLIAEGWTPPGVSRSGSNSLPSREAEQTQEGKLCRLEMKSKEPTQ